MDPKIIDTKSSIKKSNNRLLKNLPDFINNILVKIVKENDINRLLNKYKDEIGVSFLQAVLKEMDFKMEIYGEENLPENSKCFFVSNHPFGFADGLMLTNIVSKKYGTFKAIGNEVFMMIPQLRPVIAAVNVFGANPKDYLRELHNIYLSDVAITHFPAGIVSRIKNGKVCDGEWHKSFITKSVECKRDIVPIRFTGRNSTLFYTIYIIRNLLFIKLNLELMLLPKEFFNKKGKKIKIIIGKPIAYSTFDKSKSALEWAQWVKHVTYNLNEDNY